MSTRCQIGFYESKDVKPEDFEALIYRHSDGYPGKEDGSEYGVLTDIVDWLKIWNKQRGIEDLEYCSARLLQHLCNEYDQRDVDRYKKRGEPIPEWANIGTLGHGISKDFHGDIEYMYFIYPKGVKVYETRCGENPKNWKVIKTINL